VNGVSEGFLEFQSIWGYYRHLAYVNAERGFETFSLPIWICLLVILINSFTYALASNTF